MKIFWFMLQQYLPLAVLKLDNSFLKMKLRVATVLTACGIETTNGHNMPTNI